MVRGIPSLTTITGAFTSKSTEASNPTDTKTTAVATQAIDKAEQTTTQNQPLHSWSKIVGLVGLAIAVKASIVALVWHFGPTVAAQQSLAFVVPVAKILMAMFIEPVLMYVVVPTLGLAAVSALTVALSLYILYKIGMKLLNIGMTVLDKVPGGQIIKSVIAEMVKLAQNLFSGDDLFPSTEEKDAKPHQEQPGILADVAQAFSDMMTGADLFPITEEEVPKADVKSNEEKPAPKAITLVEALTQPPAPVKTKTTDEVITYPTLKELVVEKLQREQTWADWFFGMDDEIEEEPRSIFGRVEPISDDAVEVEMDDFALVL